MFSSFQYTTFDFSLKQGKFDSLPFIGHSQKLLLAYCCYVRVLRRHMVIAVIVALCYSSQMFAMLPMEMQNNFSWGRN